MYSPDISSSSKLRLTVQLSATSNIRPDVTSDRWSDNHRRRTICFRAPVQALGCPSCSRQLSAPTGAFEAPLQALVLYEDAYSDLACACQSALPKQTKADTTARSPKPAHCSTETSSSSSCIVLRGLWASSCREVSGHLSSSVPLRLCTCAARAAQPLALVRRFLSTVMDVLVLAAQVTSPLDDLAPGMEFRYVQEPYLSEINNYIRQRREHITFFMSTQDVRNELLRTVAPGISPADMYPKAHQLINDDDYLFILRDMFNLSNVLDDMEHTGAIPYHNRGHYYNVYSRLYRMLVQKAKQAQ